LPVDCTVDEFVDCPPPKFFINATVRCRDTTITGIFTVKNILKDELKVGSGDIESLSTVFAAAAAAASEASGS